MKAANDTFEAMLIKIKQIGKGVTENKPALSYDDLEKLYESLDLQSPAGLQNKVFLDFMLYFFNRGRENLRNLKKDDFVFKGQGNDRYVELKDHLTKNHRGS